MAFDKVIDSALLDAGMTATANAIRKKTGGTTPIAWDSANGFKAAVEGIDTEGGVELPELGDTAAKPTDMAADKVLYDDEGNPVTGTLPVVADGVAVFSTADHEVGGTNGDTTFNVAGVYPGTSGDGVIIRPNARLGVRKVPTSLLGNATAADVVKGKTFTSAAGFLAEGTHECETGVTLPDLTNPGDASDLAAGKELIDQNGNVVTGTVQVVSSDLLYGATSIKELNDLDGDPSVRVRVDMSSDFLMRKNSRINAYAKLPEFGNAQPGQVVKGATFTSSAGLLVEGTLEGGSGGVHMSVDGETLVITGAVTIENETLIL